MASKSGTTLLGASTNIEFIFVAPGHGELDQMVPGRSRSGPLGRPRGVLGPRGHACDAQEAVSMLLEIVAVRSAFHPGGAWLFGAPSDVAAAIAAVALPRCWM